ncbi:hypothetical protein KVV02_007324 [Mortierella alpina]|uniref:pH-response regulator protein palC n=1 Tax=Mortierella alpina TaxID=64518 RepID=A0A9P8A447_MORAP|nr:hypothetical protein KVV02_007324 [Mortierella alpina]
MTTIGYPYALPTTANVSFQEFLAPHAHYHQPLSDATAFRGRLRTALKEHKHSDRHDLLNVQSALEDYIPLLFGLVAGIDSAELRLTSDVETTWRCTISNLALTTKQPRVKQKSIHYEAIFTLLTLGYVLMDRANESSNAVQKKIQIAIGDIPNYPGFHSGEGASLGFIGNGSSGSSHSKSNSSSSSNHHSVGGSSSPGSVGVSGSVSAAAAQAGSRLLKKTGISSSSAMISSKKSTKNPSNTVGEFTDYLNDEDLAGMDHQLTTAADLYCKAAGVFEHVVQEMIPRWNDAAQDSKKMTPESSRPVDVQTSVVSAHVKLALGEAHACTVRKAAIKAARASAAKQYYATGTASPVGSGSKTSYVLLAKLTIGVKEEYERAYGLLKSVKDLNEISSDFRAHVKDAKIYYEAMAQTFLGLDAYEAQQYGKAIGFMSTARASFAALAKSSKASTIAYASAFEFRLANEKVFAFEKINNSVTFEQIPEHAALMAVMPSGRDLLSVKKYFAPRPSFGTAATAVDASLSGAGDGVSKLAYALQGAYF